MEKIICNREPGKGPVVYGIGQKRWVYHSPTGFAWGYGGSGPADLALNILYQITKDKEEAWRYHQEFKWEFIATLPWEGGEIDVAEVKEWLRERGWSG